jgi:hypothetical protein
MNARDLTALVHLVGFATGIVLYAMLGVMTRRRVSHVVSQESADLDARVPLIAAVLGVLWNTGAMIVFAARDFDAAYSFAWVGGVAYAALGFLPAAVVQSTLHRRRPGEYRWLLIVAYAASTVAGVMHLADAARGAGPSSNGLLLLTITYGGILAVLAVSERRRAGFQRMLTAVALAAFAVSALHLSRHAGIADQDPWPVELIGHHASLPLVLAILYQDYRFAFADLFLKRALALLMLVALVSILYALLAAPLIDPHVVAALAPGDSHLFSTGALLTLWIVTALAYPFIQRRVFRFVDRVILGRTDYREFRSELSRSLAAVHDVDETLDVTCTLLARAIGAGDATWREIEQVKRASHPTIALDAARVRADIVIPTAIEPAYVICVADLRDGRSLLSDDLVLIDTMAAAVGRRIDEIRVDNERVAQERREQEMRRLTTEAELRALRAQLDPHFLFNALNTLGHLIQTAPDRGLPTLYKLTALLRAVLRRTNGKFVSLREELEIVESYLAIEHVRFQERLSISIDVADDLREVRVPPLLIQPLVENAVKHGIAPQRGGGRVSVRAWRDTTPGDEGGFLRIEVIDTGRGMGETASTNGTGVGLSNIQSRLDHYFGAAAMMAIRPTTGGGTTVELCVPWLGRA